MIDMQGIKKVYRSGLIALEALSDFTLRGRARRVRGDHGPLGLGQDHVPEHRRPARHASTRARYLLDGEDVQRCCDNDLAQLRNRKIGFVFQSFNLIPDLDVHDNVEVPLRYRGLRAAEREPRIERGAGGGRPDRAPAPPARASSPAASSSAWRSRARWSASPTLILADEPTGNLDSVMAGQIMDLLARINRKGTTIVMVTHSPELAARADRKLHILDGKAIDPWAGRKRGARDARAGAVMLDFYLRGALRSLRRTPVLSSVMVVDLALGLAIWVLAFTAVDSHTRDPIADSAPICSTSTGAARPRPTSERLERLSAACWRWRRTCCSRTRDAERLSRAPGGRAQRADLHLADRARPAASRVEQPGALLHARAVPDVRAGLRVRRPWSAAAERGRTPLLVLDHASNQRLFGGDEQRRAQRSLIDGRAFLVVGRARGGAGSGCAPSTSRSCPCRRCTCRSSCSRRSARGRTTSAPRSLHGPRHRALDVARPTPSCSCGWSCPTRARRSAIRGVPRRAGRAAQRRARQRSRRVLEPSASFIDESVPIPNGFLRVRGVRVPRAARLLREPVAAADREVPGARARAGGAARVRRHARLGVRAVHDRGRCW